MTALLEPCFERTERAPLPDDGRIRVVELLATGTMGGAQEHLYSLLTRLDRARYEPHVVSLSEGSTVRRIERAGFAVTVIQEPDDAVAVRAVAEQLRALRPAVLHSHMFRAEVVGTRAAVAVADEGRPRPFVVSTVHSSRVRSLEDRETLARLTPKMDHLIAVSRAIADKIAAEGRRGTPVSVVPNGVDLDRYDHQAPCCTLPEEFGFAPGTPIVGVVARLEPEKGHTTLLQAWPEVLRAVPEARLLIVGEGSRTQELAVEAAALGLAGSPDAPLVGSRGIPADATVVFTGRRDDIPAVTAALDVAVLPSYREAQGLSVLEAMALRRPIVASNVGGIPEMVENGRSGLLVPPGDPAALAAAIVRLLRDHPLADTLARQAHDVVRERFCVELMVRRIADIYDAGAAAVAALAAVCSRAS